MRTLEFTVEKQQLRKKAGCDFSNIVAGSIGYLKAKFYFSEEEWKDCRKVASFWIGATSYPVRLDENDECIVPSEVLGEDKFLVSVKGARVNNGKATYKIETNKFKVRQEVR